MKQFIKSLLGRFYCLLFGVKYQKGIYIGIGSKLIGGGKSSPFRKGKDYASGHVGQLEKRHYRNR